MTIKVGPTKIKETMYLRIPKNIAEMIDVDVKTEFLLNVKLNGKKHILEYKIQ